MPDPPTPDSSPDTPEPGASGRLGIVLSGGGARAAYQVGFLRFLSRRFPRLRIPVVTGVSAGAINAAHLAAHHGSFAQAVEELSGLWSHLTVQDVFRTDTRSLGANLLRWAFRLVAGGHASPSRTRGMVDTGPLRRYLKEVLHTIDGELTGIRYNLERGRLRALGLSASSYTTGQSVTWIEGREGIEGWERPHRVGRRTTLTVEHVMASCALPLFFPAVQLPDGWYGDGGIRLTAPVSPAIHLGADRVLVISTRYAPSIEEARAPVVRGYPPPAQIVSQLANSVFLDLLDQDAFRVERLNRLLRKLPPEEREGLRPVDLLTLRPSRDLGRLAGGFEPELPKVFRWLTRGLGTRETQSPDALSIILFEPDYLRFLMDTGEADAEDRADEIEAFVRGEETILRAGGAERNPLQ